MRYCNTLSKQVLLRVFTNSSFTRSAYNNDLLNMMLKRAIALVHEMSLTELTLLNQHINRWRVSDVVWFSTVSGRLLREMDSESLNRDHVLELVDSLSSGVITVSLYVKAIDVFKVVEGYFISHIH
jgi:hypothetical protein